MTSSQHSSSTAVCARQAAGAFAALPASRGAAIWADGALLASLVLEQGAAGSGDVPEFVAQTEAVHDSKIWVLAQRRAVTAPIIANVAQSGGDQ